MNIHEKNNRKVQSAAFLITMAFAVAVVGFALLQSSSSGNNPMKDAHESQYDVSLSRSAGASLSKSVTPQPSPNSEPATPATELPKSIKKKYDRAVKALDTQSEP